MNISEIKKICATLDIKPKRSKGQNFLWRKNIVAKMVGLAGLSKKDTVVEVGPGFGVLTRELSKNVKKVVSLELDKKIYSFLENEFADIANVELINKDLLKVDLDKLKLGRYKVVANLPYQITSAAIRKFLTAKNKPEQMTIMVQKEVAQRVIASPPKMNLLALSVQYFGQPSIEFVIKNDNYWPKPKVDSAVLQIKNIQQHSQENNQLVDEDLFFKFIRAGFSSKRKLLINNLCRGLKLDKKKVELEWQKVGLSANIRAENLDLKLWLKLIGKIG